MVRELSVRLCGKPVGTLRLSSGSMVFQYKNASRSLSLSMPIRDEPYTNKACEAYFGGLLPDNTQTKQLIAKLYGIASNSSFGLLEKIGFDCAGAVSLVEHSESVEETAAFKLRGCTLSEEELYTHLKELPDRPLFIGIEGLRISLAGAQEKTALCVIDGEICVPNQNVPTTHILKPRIRGLEQSVVNEYLCMRLAKIVGIQTPNVEIRTAGEIEYLLVERHDRFIENGLITRIHQEDFCQALGVVSTKKYQSDGGPSIQNCFDLLEKTTYPALAKVELLKRVIFNYLVGNADCHGKNFSLLHTESSSILAPAYDVLCTAIYVADSSNQLLSTKFAMAIGGESDMYRIRLKNWQRFCELIKVSPAACKRTCLELIDRVIKAAPELQFHLLEIGHWNPIADRICKLIEERAQELRGTANKLS
ncbi:MAG TPA: type II toxin-antitoxin system HipA family toxin [Planktothrix sp.]|jgi:serine/threonine-protein kinase HipA